MQHMRQRVYHARADHETIDARDTEVNRHTHVPGRDPRNCQHAQREERIHHQTRRIEAARAPDVEVAKQEVPESKPAVGGEEDQPGSCGGEVAGREGVDGGVEQDGPAGYHDAEG